MKIKNQKSKIKIKICGITNLEDARACLSAGCDALGFVFYKKSPRYITPLKAKEIIMKLPKNITKIGVFVNAKEKTIKNIAKLCNLDILQFHGNETPEFCRTFSGFKIIKAFRVNPVRNTIQTSVNKKVSNGVKDKIDFAKVLKYKTFAYLFDAFKKSKFGGTGERFNWELLKYLEDIKQPIFISGGLNERNVRKAIEIIRPDWIDVSSSVEIKPGKKNHEKVKEFIRAIKVV